MAEHFDDVPNAITPQQWRERSVPSTSWAPSMIDGAPTLEWIDDALTLTVETRDYRHAYVVTGPAQLHALTAAANAAQVVDRLKLSAEDVEWLERVAAKLDLTDDMAFERHNGLELAAKIRALLAPLPPR